MPVVMSVLQVIWIIAASISAAMVFLDILTFPFEHRNQDNAALHMKKALVVFMAGTAAKTLKWVLSLF